MMRTKITQIAILLAFAANFAAASFADEPTASVGDPNLWSTATQPGERNELTVNGVLFAFRYCPPTGPDGFLMGSSDDEKGRRENETRHNVVLTEGFWIMETELTQKEWLATLNLNPSCYRGDDRPVESVAWYDVDLYVKRLNADGCAPDGYRFSLPSEAQWEYACRAGGAEPNDPDSLDERAWFSKNSDDKTHDVGLKRPNAWGICDMLGNVAEWTFDTWKETLTEPETDPWRNDGVPRVTSGDNPYFARVYRGGSINDDAGKCRPGYRDRFSTTFDVSDLGFRLVLVRDHDREVDAIFSPEPTSNASSDPKWSTTTRSGERMELTIDGVVCSFNYCPPTGADGFLMGSPDDESGRQNDETRHNVVLTDGFWLGSYEVTQKLYKAVTGKDPSVFKGEELPVDSVSWFDCRDFVKALNSRGVAPEGWAFSLPTEAQWEYACRAGGSAPFSFGNALNVDKANCLGTPQMDANGRAITLGRPNKVGSYPCNAWGLYDMHGNLWEWTLDYYAEYPKETATDPKGPTNGVERVLRGGSWFMSPDICRAANRGREVPAFRGNYNGFRLVLVRRSAE